ncbi:hypothetical protein B0H10DRAFT_1997573 [Mycena sp. CBHHK59/15]|nr:hypothetical protein B0H10DRAFT_1997573 [Mycena sp. CBHHK59/15]
MASLFEPLKLGNITIPNRIIMSPLTRSRAIPDLVPNDTMLKYYLQRVHGGAGLIITEGTLVTRQGTEWPYAPGIWNEDQVKGWKKITDAIHGSGGFVYCQLWHVGRLSHPEAPEQIAAGQPVYAPSAISAHGGDGKFRQVPGRPGYVTPTEIPDPRTLVAVFKQAAVNAKAAGFDGVELHGAYGYLVMQFLDSGSNLRTDSWGGSIENRSRFGLEVLKALIEVFGSNVGIKLGPCGGGNDVGMPLQETLDTYKYFIREADKLQLSYIVLMRYSPSLDAEYDGKKRATVHDVLAAYRPLIKNAKVIVNAGVTPEEGAELVKSGKADAFSMGLNWITHPDVANRIQRGQQLDNVLDVKHLYGNPHVDLNIGYTTYV